jgi:hypothetical protein
LPIRFCELPYAGKVESGQTLNPSTQSILSGYSA